jgi:hypothetical protein
MIRADVHETPADNGTALGANGTAGSPISGWANRAWQALLD